MELAAASAPVAAWIGVGALLGAAAALLVGLLLALGTQRRRAQVVREEVPLHDDLATFLDSPPGSSAAPPLARDGLVPLATTAPAGSTVPPVTRPGVPAAVAGLATLFVITAAGLARALGDDEPDPGARAAVADRPPSPPGASEPVETRLRFPGMVLEQRAVGITATYPEVEVVGVGGAPIARLTLPTWNCLSPAAPEDPVVAGCVPTPTEYAELRPPALQLTRDDDGLRLAGTFPTSTRPNGSPPDPTGRAYGLELVVTTTGEALDDGSREAVGHLHLGEGTARAEGVLHPVP